MDEERARLQRELEEKRERSIRNERRRRMLGIDPRFIEEQDALKRLLDHIGRVRDTVAWGEKQVDPAARNAVSFSAVQEITMILRQLVTMQLREHMRTHGDGKNLLRSTMEAGLSAMLEDREENDG